MFRPVFALPQEQFRQRKRDRGLVVEVQWTLDLEAQGEVQFSGIMDEFLNSARLGRDRLDVASEDVMVPSPDPTDLAATSHVPLQRLMRWRCPADQGPGLSGLNSSWALDLASRRWWCAHDLGRCLAVNVPVVGRESFLRW